MDQATTLPTRHRLDVDIYFRMAEAGVFPRTLRIELIDGELIDMAPIGQPHESIVNRLNETLVLSSGGRTIVSVHNSVRLDRFNAPEPDFAVFKRREDFYGTGERAGPADVLLLIEVSDSSLTYDRSVKLALYARSGIAEYWIVDTRLRTVIVHRSPSGTGYDSVVAMKLGDSIALALDPDIVIDLHRVFG